MTDLVPRGADRRLIVLVVCLTAVVALAAVGIIIASDPSATLRRNLEIEFDGAYPVEAAGGGEIVEIELVASDSTIDLVDGTTTDVWAYNEAVPGPAIRVSLGDTLRITVRNELVASTTIHWHGIRVPNDMDGVPDVNQPKIEPGEEFVYEFTPPDAGTYWYHSHTDGSQQLERGLYGSVVIEDLGEAADYAHDVVWVIDDWLLDDDRQIVPEFNTEAERTQNGRWGNLITVNASIDEELRARPGERVRLRLINASNGRVYIPDFGNLEAVVIAIDGLTVKTNEEATGVVLAPGNRADIDITVPNTAGTYEVHDVFGGAPQPLASVVVVEDPVFQEPFVPPTNPDVPDWSKALDAPVDHELVFDTTNVDDEWIWMINGAAYPEHEPLELAAERFIKIRLVNQTHPLHPIHLHGQFFKVLTRNGEPVDEPHFRDTVLLDRLDVVEIGLVPLDVGTWVLHCHIQEHAEAGMMTVVNVE